MKAMRLRRLILTPISQQHKVAQLQSRFPADSSASWLRKMLENIYSSKMSLSDEWEMRERGIICLLLNWFSRIYYSFSYIFYITYIIYIIYFSYILYYSFSFILDFIFSRKVVLLLASFAKRKGQCELCFHKNRNKHKGNKTVQFISIPVITAFLFVSTVTMVWLYF